MENDDETQENKSYADLTNVNLETHDNHQFKFEKFLLSGNSDNEEDNEENLMCSDASNSEEEISNFEYSIQHLSNSPQHISLTTEDRITINSSLHPELKKSLTMNRTVKYMTLQLFNKIKDLLIKNQDKIKALKKILEKNESKECHVMLLGQLGAPYFKTKKDMFCCNPNKDTLDRRKRGLLTIYQTMTFPKWSRSECGNLTRGIQLTYNHNKQKAILKEITALKGKLDDEDSKITSQIVDKIEQLESEVRNLKTIGINDIPPLSENKFIDWEHISTEFIMDKHNAQDCSTFWHIYLHPDINKSNWTNEENRAIQRLAEKYKNQNWDQVAKELGTNRTGFSVFLYYSSTLCNQLPKSRFTEEEDRKLVQLVESRKIGSYIPWHGISEFFPNRSKLQLMNRYKYYLNNVDQYTHEFSDAEDILILLLVERFGRNYMKFTKYLPSKSYMQIKARYDNHLRLSRIMGCFSLEEDKKILAHFSNMHNEVGSLTVALHRNRLQVRQRYNKLKEFFEKNPDKSLENVPRRSGKKNETFRRMQFLKYIGNQFEGYVDVPTIDEIEKKLGKRKQSKSDDDIDVLIVNFFSASYTVKQKSLELTTPKITNAADKIYNILKSWRVNLNIPAEIRKNNAFDIIDVEILNLLRDKYHSDIHTPTIDDLLPPNMNSLIGLRGLLLKNQLFKKPKFKTPLTLKNNLPPIRNDHDTQIAHELLNIYQNKDISTQCLIENERSLFLERFISMFMWPALLSIESPSEQISKIECRLKNAEQPKNKKKVEDKPKNKIIKRSLEEKSDVLVSKKCKLSNEKQKPKSYSIQPQRFSSRLKNKNQISNKNETREVEQEHPAIESSQNTTNVNDSNQEIQNAENSNKSNQIVELVKPTNVTTCGNTKMNPNNNLPSNLVKVDKSEILKLLQNKKPIKIFQIKSIKKPDGTITTITEPSHIKIDEKMNNMNKPVASGASGLAPLAESIKSNFKLKFNTANINKNTNNLNDSCKKNTEGKPSYRKGPIDSTNNPNKFSESSVNKSVEFNHTEDLNKLDAFLNNVGDEDCLIDLTENEVMKNELNQLDKLIKQESSFNLTPF